MGKTARGRDNRQDQECDQLAHSSSDPVHLGYTGPARVERDPTSSITPECERRAVNGDRSAR